ncbi:50S ribosomal protein L4 [Nitrogeniibacter mangrovi]|uniref:Large ribosomal subunit protein uL4 n=1 Tax=Nitrogeniibacter mangrovi TaxID=2016596 RepID=A0A6C1B9N8_9RHOO|nr:50S ribosomal protein L4 [Nitrogeniibacter mangrovi]QID19060.1 50S ribosomal protein L4 [Nitrogeniibacter mangrovi]
MELKLLNDQGQSAETVQVSDALFGREFNEALVHQVVVAYMANARSANRKQKGRAEVQKSTRKPWRQKGTGRARAGMASSPIWRGGGKIFPNTPDENFSQKINRKMFRAGVASILSELARQGRISVVEDFSLEAPKTKLLAGKLKGMGLESVLVITDDLNENLFLSSRNLRDVLVLDVSEADPVSLVRFPQVVVTKGALAKMQEVWQ